MKIYLFCPETGIYQGEDFSDAPPMCRGGQALPACATTVVPPAYRRAEVPVFSVTKDKWEIRSIFQLLAGSGHDQCEQPGYFDEPRNAGRAEG